MTDRQRSFLKELMYYGIAILGIVAILFITYAIKGIAPFGNGTVAEIDVGCGSIPSMYHLWDCLHGKADFFYEYYTLGGVESYSQTVFDGLLSPINLLVGLFRREHVIFFYNYAMIIRVVLMIVIAFFVFRKLFPKLNINIVLLFSFAWAFSGWMLVHNMVYSFVDVVMVFPLLALGFKRIMEKEKCELFMIVLTYGLIVNFYISYMLLLGIIMCGGTAILFFVPKDRRKRVVAKLTLAILGSFLISAVAVFPAVITSLRSARMTGAKVEYNNGFLFSKLFVLTALAIIPFAYIMLIRNYKKDKPTIRFFLIAVGFTVIGLILERVNLMWHTGSYWSYPYRYSFIAMFLLILGGLYYFDRFYGEEKQEAQPNKWFIVTMVIGLFALISFTILEGVVYAYINPAFKLSYVQWILELIPTGIAGFLLYKAFKLESKKLRYIFTGVICGIQIAALSIAMIGTIKDIENDSRLDNNVYLAQEMYNVDFVPDTAYRYKDKDEILYYRGNETMRRDSVSGWIHLLTQSGSDNFKNLGYDTYGPTSTSAGSTLFGDMLTNTKYVISQDDDLDPAVYTYIKSMHSDYLDIDVYLYEYKYTLPIGLVLDKDILEIEIPDYLDTFEMQNFIYRNYLGYTEDILTDIGSSYRQDRAGRIEFTLDNVDGNLYINMENNQKASKIYINGVEKKAFNSIGIIDLGVYHNETVKIAIEGENTTLNHKDYEFKVIDIAKIQSLSERFASQEVTLTFEGNKIKASVTADTDKVLYIPYTYSSYMTVQDADRSINGIMGSFIAVGLNEGENNITIAYKNTLIMPSLIISIVALILTILVWVIHHFTKLLNKKGVYTTVFVVGVLMAVCVVAYVFVLPLIKTFLW